jgi:hypothetical protein
VCVGRQNASSDSTRARHQCSMVTSHCRSYYRAARILLLFSNPNCEYFARCKAVRDNNSHLPFVFRANKTRILISIDCIRESNLKRAHDISRSQNCAPTGKTQFWTRRFLSEKLRPATAGPLWWNTTPGQPYPETRTDKYKPSQKGTQRKERFSKV